MEQEKEQEKEKKAGAVVAGRKASAGSVLFRWLGLGGPGQTASTLGRATIGGAHSSLSSFLATHSAMVAATAALTGAAVYGLYALNSPSSAREARDGSSLFPSSEVRS